MKEMLPENEGIRLFDINWKCKTAGPSPANNERVEVFLLGCKKAAEGHACPGCFNSITWNDSIAEYSWNPEELADKITNYTSNRYITIGGGEPTDQIENLIPFCKRLKKHGFNILMYTWKELKHNDNSYEFIQNIFESDHYLDVECPTELMKYIDIVIDGDFRIEEQLYIDDTYDGLYGSVGSGNQCIWDIKNNRKEYMRNLKGIKLDNNNNLIYIMKEED